MFSPNHTGYVDGYLYKHAVDAAEQNAPGFLTEVNGEPLKNDKGLVNKYRLRTPLKYRDAEGNVITIPAGFITDYYTIPQVADKLVPGFSKKLNKDPGPAVLHDWLYRTGRINNKPIQKMDADRLLYEAMQTRGLDPLYVQAVKLGLTYGGSPAWHAYRVLDKITAKYPAFAKHIG